MRLLFVFLLSLLCLLSACSSDNIIEGDVIQVKPQVEVSAVTDLTVIAGSDNSVTLNWTSPSVVDKADVAISYDLRHTSLVNAGADWDTWFLATPPTGDTAENAARTFEVTGLEGGETYVFGLEVVAEENFWVAGDSRALALATAAEVFDTIRPAPVRDLKQWAGTASSLTWAWTAAGDDSVYGAATSHELRYSTTPITAENWDQALVPSSAPIVAPVAGMLQSTVDGLEGDTSYYFAVVAIDDQGLHSGLSNMLSAATVDLNVINVTVDGLGDYPTIERAIGAAQPGDLILVGPGRYTWDDQGTGDPLHGMINVPRDWQDFELRSMAGAEQTILDAQGNGAVMSVTGGSRPAPGGGLDYAGITIDGFTFTGGAANGEEASAEMGWAGGGINVHLSDSIIRNCIFRGNEATTGGGVWIGGQGDAILEDCLIENNTSVLGGGVMLINSAPRITVRRCTIRDNYASRVGGGLFAYHCTMTLADCLITENRTGSNGGGVGAQVMNPDGEITGCTIAGNEANQKGAGIYLSTNTLLRIENTVVAFNKKSRGITGVGVSSVEMGCSLVFGNEDGDGLPWGSVDLGTNVYADPLFCDLVDFRPGPDSPCLPLNRADDSCGLIGVWDQGCTGF
jgi:hypothetical protein